MSAVDRLPRFALLPARDRRLIERRALPFYALIVLAFAVCTLPVLSGAFDYDPNMVLDCAVPVGFFLVVIWAIRWAGGGALADFAEVLLLGAVTGFVMTFCAALFATANLPLADAALARADAALFGFRREMLTAFMAANHWFGVAMRAAYLSLGWTPQLLLALLFATGRGALGWRVAVTLALALAVAIGLSWILPAYGVPPYPYRFQEVLDGLRAGQLRRFDPSLVTGIVTFPSVHAADAVVLAWGYARAGRLGWPLAALNAVMVVSAVAVGGHYVVDVVAGAAIAAACIRATAILERFYERRPIIASSPPAAS